MTEKGWDRFILSIPRCAKHVALLLNHVQFGLAEFRLGRAAVLVLEPVVATAELGQIFVDLDGVFAEWVVLGGLAVLEEDFDAGPLDGGITVGGLHDPFEFFVCKAEPGGEVVVEVAREGKGGRGVMVGERGECEEKNEWGRGSK